LDDPRHIDSHSTGQDSQTVNELWLYQFAMF